jgi:hypothetical protein
MSSRRGGTGRARLAGLVIGVSVVVAGLAGCAAPSQGASHAPPSHAPVPHAPVPHAGVAPPPPGGGFDYQLGGTYAPPGGVEVVGRDSTARPSGRYDVCYVNGFQTQPQDRARWRREAPELLLQRNGTPAVDPGWPDEYLLDVSTAAKRTAILHRVAPSIRRCARQGFDAVEIDNLDSWTRSHGAFGIADAVAMARSYADLAHSLHLAIAQKNAAGYSARMKRQVGFDFAITEECVRYRECGDYLGAYGQRVYDVEYGQLDCAATGRPKSTILRDRDLVAAGEGGYVRRAC